MVTDILVWILYAACLALCVSGAWAYIKWARIAKQEEARAQENEKLKAYEASGLSPAQVRSLQGYVVRIAKEHGKGGTNA